MLSKLWTEEKRNQSSFEEVKNLAKTLNIDLNFSVINLKKQIRMPKSLTTSYHEILTIKNLLKQF